ncbi:MAG: helix-turn-helix transcriptional regulator [Candidatus Cryptobacteroides sp.]
MDQPKLERMLRLMKLLSSNVDYSVDELAQKMGLSFKTIYRYLDSFKEAGFVVNKLYGSVYKLGLMPVHGVDLERLIYFSEEEAYLVNSLIDQLTPSNSLKSNLKSKLSAIYGCTSIADYVDKRSNAAHVEALGKAIADKQKVILKSYESGNTHSIRDRYVEPFAFTTDYIEVWAYDLEDHKNKSFKVNRIGEVQILEEDWSEEASHQKDGMDIFHLSGKTSHRVRLQMSHYAKNLLIEEYPLAEKDLKKEGEHWILDTQVYNYAGACRFYAGLMQEISIVDSPEFQDYVRDYLSKSTLLQA